MPMSSKSSLIAVIVGVLSSAVFQLAMFVLDVENQSSDERDPLDVIRGLLIVGFMFGTPPAAGIIGRLLIGVRFPKSWAAGCIVGMVYSISTLGGLYLARHEWWLTIPPISWVIATIVCMAATAAGDLTAAICLRLHRTS